MKINSKKIKNKFQVDKKFKPKRKRKRRGKRRGKRCGRKKP